MLSFLNAALSAIPNVLGDTRALIAYVVAIVGWSVVALKVQRNKNLLLHLSKLPERDRLQALQMEMGAVPVPDGMTPAQFIAARTHTYFFYAFALLCVVMATIAALAITYKSASADDVAQGVGNALKADRKLVAAEAPTRQIQEAQDKIEALKLRRIPEYYIQVFGQPSDRGKDGNVTYLVWMNELFELDMSFVGGRSTEYCVVSQDKKFMPKIPGEGSVRLGQKALAELSDRYLWSNFGSAGGSTVVTYGLSGSHAEDFLYEYVAYAESPAEYPDIKGSEKLARLKSLDDTDVNTVDGSDPINAFAVSTTEFELEGPVCLQLPLWKPW